MTKPLRNILHFDLDTFYVSVERLEDNRLEGRPILVGGTGERGVVAACSYEAKAFGVYSGLSMKVARTLCPEAVVIRGNAGKYSGYSRVVTDIIKETVPAYEKASIDEFYIDLTGMETFFGTYSFGKDLRQRIIKHSGLPISMALAENKTVSKVATGEAKPNNEINIVHGTERNFLAPLSVRKLPQVGAETFKELKEMGILTIKTLQNVPEKAIIKIFGERGRKLWLRSHGIDNSPLIPYFEQASLTQQRTYGRDTIDVNDMKELIRAMAENLGYQLRCGNKLASRMSLQIKYSDFHTESKQKQIPYTSLDDHLIRHSMELFNALYTRRILVRTIALKCSHMVEGGFQMNLMDEDTSELVRLYQAMDKVRNKWGSSRTVMRASALNIPNMGTWNPFTGEPPTPPAHRQL